MYTVRKALQCQLDVASIFQRFLQHVIHGSSGSFSLPIALWLSRAARGRLDVPQLRELSELDTRELMPVV